MCMSYEKGLICYAVNEVTSTENNNYVVSVNDYIYIKCYEHVLNIVPNTD